MKPSTRRSKVWIALTGLVVALVASHEASAQICRPVSERTGELGCWITAHTVLGQLPSQSIFWHLDTYPTRAAAEAVKGPRGTVVESLGKVWLLTIEVAGWRPSGGDRIAEIGPLPVTTATNYSAQYMEAIFTPGMTAPAHRHSGPEAWYTVAGETCLRNARRQDGRASGRLTSHCAGRSADASHSYWHGDPPGVGAYSS